MKKCILAKWYTNIIIFFIFGLSFMFLVNQNQKNYSDCVTNLSKQEVCETGIEKVIFDKVIQKNDTEKINTNIVVINGSSTYNFFSKYGKFLGFAIGFLVMIIVFLLYGIKFIFGLGKFKIINIFALIIGYGLSLLLGLNFIYWEPRFTEIGVAASVYLGKPLTNISFYLVLILIIMLIIKTIVSLFSNKKENEKNN